MLIVVATTIFVYLLISDDRPTQVLQNERYGPEDRPKPAPVEGRKRRRPREGIKVRPPPAPVKRRDPPPVKIRLLDPDPVPRPPAEDAKYDPDARYLAYFTHSGYHNQVSMALLLY